MTTANPKDSANTSLLQDWIYAGRYYLGNRRAILILSLIAVGGGIALNWSWLVATGIAPILLAALPCAAMCALGLCGDRLFGGSCASEPSASVRSEMSDVESIEHSKPVEAANNLTSHDGESTKTAVPAIAREGTTAEQRSDSNA